MHVAVVLLSSSRNRAPTYTVADKRTIAIDLLEDLPENSRMMCHHHRHNGKQCKR